MFFQRASFYSTLTTTQDHKLATEVVDTINHFKQVLVGTPVNAVMPTMSVDLTHDFGILPREKGDALKIQIRQGLKAVVVYSPTKSGKTTLVKSIVVCDCKFSLSRFVLQRDYQEEEGRKSGCGNLETGYEQLIGTDKRFGRPPGLYISFRDACFDGDIRKHMLKAIGVDNECKGAARRAVHLL